MEHHGEAILMTQMFSLPERSPESAEYWLTTHRCKRCNRFFRERDYEDAAAPEEIRNCYYHPGQPLNLRGPSLSGWSCCITASEELKGLGCAKAGGLLPPQHLYLVYQCLQFFPLWLSLLTITFLLDKHEVDVPFEASLAHFPFSEEEAAARDNRSKEEKAKDKTNMPPEEDGYLIHEVVNTDTLMGLAIRYKTTVAELQKINKLPNHQIFVRKYLYIPKSDEIQVPIRSSPASINRATLVAAFKTETGASAEEAKYYLSDADDNLKLALENWKKDMDWQTKRGSQKK
jgi:LysM repeat protein